MLAGRTKLCQGSNMRVSVALLALAVTLPAPLAAQGQSDATRPQAPGADKEKLICKRETPIGSLIASRKVCLTKSQWAERERIGNEVARDMVQQNQTRPGGM
jgi:hypothetical protein